MEKKKKGPVIENIREEIKQVETKKQKKTNKMKNNTNELNIIKKMYN